MIKKCDDGCSNKYGPQGAQFQDKKYGTNMRVMVETNNGWRCTICDKESTITIGKKKK